MGLRPTPRKGAMPPSPLYWGFAPRGIKFGGFSLLWPCVPIWGYAPKPRARGLNTDKKKMCGKGRGRGVCAATLQLIEKTVRHRRRLSLFQRFISSKMRLRARRLARGLGRSPKWVRKVKAERRHKHMIPWGEAPTNGVQGDYPPAGVWGGTPTSPTPSCQYAKSLCSAHCGNKGFFS